MRSNLINLARRRYRRQQYSMVRVCYLALLIGPFAFATRGVATESIAEETVPVAKDVRPILFGQSINLSVGAFQLRHEVDDMYFEGIIKIMPVLTLTFGSSDERYLDIRLTVTGQVSSETDLGNRLWLNYRLARQLLDYPDQHIAEVKTVFDSGESRGDGNGRVVVPHDARRLQRLEIVWWGGPVLPIRRNLVWECGDVEQTPKIFIGDSKGNKATSYPAKLNIFESTNDLRIWVEPSHLHVRWVGAPGLQNVVVASSLSIALGDASAPGDDFPWEKQDLVPPGINFEMPLSFEFEVKASLEIEGNPRTVRFLVIGPEQGSYEQRRRYFHSSEYFSFLAADTIP